jgi:hypothetical protein
MWEFISYLKIFLISILLLSVTTAQNFDIDAYRDFLNQHQDMTTEELLSMHPAGAFVDDISLNYQDALYFDSLDAKYNFTDYEKSLIGQHCFMVSERLNKVSFGEAMLEIFHSDLPVFVSTDAILHAFHISYNRILMDVEAGFLEGRLINILSELRYSISQLDLKYSNYPQMNTMLKDVDIYLTVPLLLLEENVSPYYPENDMMIDSILTWIENKEGHVASTLFSTTCRIMDWSQFKPRGHYVNDGTTRYNLEPYFKAMMWLSRVELYLLAPSSAPFPCPNQSFEDVQRQTIDAILIDELFDIASVKLLYEEMEEILKFFVGDPDNVTVANLDYLRNAVQLDSASQLLNNSKLLEFQDTLKNQEFAYQLILSQILYSDPLSPDSIIPASAFMLFGQRFVIDSYVTASVVFDRIMYQGSKVCRLLPSTLDVLFSLGNDASAQLLDYELDNYHYATNLAALRYLIDHYDSDFWSSTIYNHWLELIRSINPPEDRNGLPAFMKTAAYWQQKMNTQLSSWTELRHDNLLYAKQSYTGGPVCSYPYSYIEPFPEFYRNLKSLGEVAYEYFSNVTFINQFFQNGVTAYFLHLISVADTLTSISEKELLGEPFTPEEIHFLKTMLYETAGCVLTLDGWYSKLYYSDLLRDFDGIMLSDHLVADIHTVPTDCGGIQVGWINHVGTGPINLAVILTKNHNSELTAFVGPVMSYFEYTTTNFLRLTDDEWADTYLQSALRPDWVNIYLADSLGNSRGDGRSLFTSVEADDKDIIIPQSEILLSNYPNPFNPNTIIAFTVPYELTNSQTTLSIYDIQGSLIRSLVNEDLPAGNYLTNWDGKNEIGINVSSGVYIYNLRVAHRQVSRKMILMR